MTQRPFRTWIALLLVVAMAFTAWRLVRDVRRTSTLGTAEPTAGAIASPAPAERQTIDLVAPGAEASTARRETSAVSADPEARTQEEGEAQVFEGVATPHALEGRVVWPDGSPAPGARISVGVKERYRSFQTGETLAGPDGLFFLSADRKGPLWIVARAERVEPAADSFDLVRRAWRVARSDVFTTAADLRLVLEPTMPVKGRVVDDRGLPWKVFDLHARRVGMRVLDRDDGDLRREFRSPDGRFELEGFFEGRWNLSAGAGGVRSEVRTIEIPGDGSSLEVVLQRSGSVSGKVVDETGQGVGLASVLARMLTEDKDVEWSDFFSGGGSRIETRTAEDGTFELEALRGGPIRLIAIRDGYANSEPLAFELLPGGRSPGHVLMLRTSGRITGEVHESLGPHASVYLRLAETGKQVASGWTDEARRFAFTDLAAGVYDVIVTVQERGDFSFQWVRETSPRREVRVELGPGEERHIVVGEPTAQAIRLHGQIWQGPDVPATSLPLRVESDSWSAATKTDAEGRYEFWLESAGTYTLTAGRERAVSLRVDVPEAGEHTQDFTLPGGSVSGVVLGRDGAPRAEVGVQLVTLSKPSPFAPVLAAGWRRARTDDSGQFTFWNVPAGRFVAHVGKRGWTLEQGLSWESIDLLAGMRDMGEAGISERFEVRENDAVEDVEIVIAPQAVLSGRVVDENRRPVVGATVAFELQGRRAIELGSMATTNDKGEFRIGGLVAGNGSVFADAEGFTATREARTLAAGEEVRVELVLER